MIENLSTLPNEVHHHSRSRLAWWVAWIGIMWIVRGSRFSGRRWRSIGNVFLHLGFGDWEWQGFLISFRRIIIFSLSHLDHRSVVVMVAWSFWIKENKPQTLPSWQAHADLSFILTYESNLCAHAKVHQYTLAVRCLDTHDECNVVFPLKALKLWVENNFLYWNCSKFPLFI